MYAWRNIAARSRNAYEYTFSVILTAWYHTTQRHLFYVDSTGNNKT
jgi:hypothetical protein